MLISIVFVKAIYDVTYLKLTLYHVLVLMFLFLLIGILSAENNHLYKHYDKKYNLKDE